MFVHKIEEDLVLRLIQLKDAESVFELTNNSRQYLREWLPWLDMTKTIDDTTEFINTCLKSHYENKSMNSVILFRNKIVGIAGFNEINWSNKTAYIGYWLGEEYQGNGIMTKVARALTNYAFYELNLNKVEIRVATGNKKSKNIPVSLGYIKEGNIRQAELLYNSYVDHTVYGILADEWDRKR